MCELEGVDWYDNGFSLLISKAGFSQNLIRSNNGYFLKGKSDFRCCSDEVVVGVLIFVMKGSCSYSLLK